MMVRGFGHAGRPLFSPLTIRGVLRSRVAVRPCTNYRSGAYLRQGNSYQVPLSVHVRREAEIMTMAIGREILDNPNWPMDAVVKPGVEGPFGGVTPRFGWWLATPGQARLRYRALDLAKRPH
jgi:hypothetical protein